MQSSGWSLPRSVLVASHALVWLGAGFLFDFDYRVVAFSDPLITVLLAAGLVLTAALAAREAPWLYASAGAATALVPFVALFAFNAVFAIGQPGLGNRYIGAVLLLLALVLAVPAAVQGRAAASGRRPVVPLRRWSHSRQGVYAWGAVAVAVGMAWTGAMAADAPAPRQARTYDFDAASAGLASRNVTAVDNAFEGPDPLPAGEVVELVVSNEGRLFHTFTYEVGGVEHSHDLPAGARVNVLVHFADEGVVAFRCIPHSLSYDDDPADGMVGRIVVEPAASG